MSARSEAALTAKRPGFVAGFPSRAKVVQVAEKTRGALTALNLHFAGAALLGLLNIYLLIHMAFLWQAARSQDENALAQQRVQLKTAQIMAAPLEGLDGKLSASTGQADSFYDRRFPYAFSQVLTELGALAKKENAKLTRVQYGYTPLFLDGAASATGTPSLTQVQMDASLTGDYRSLVQLINDLERDRTFFLISGVALSGQQSGSVSLRLKVATYLRPAHGEERAEPLPASNLGDEDTGAASDSGDSAKGGPAR